MNRRKTRIINVGDVAIGGDSPISVQSMTNTDTKNIPETVKQIRELTNAGCDIIRIAVPDMEAAEAFPAIIQQTDIPIIADIHFDYKLAIKSIENGASAIRINPGNIGSKERVSKVIRAAKKAGVSIRIGVNSGSLEKDIKQKYGVSAEALTKSAMRHVEFFEENDFVNIKISLKSSSVPMTIESYQKMAQLVNYPFHLGITEAGTKFSGTIKSSIGIGALLAQGIGDTIRVSLTDNPIEEIKVGIEILKALGLRKGVDFISCPTCGRTQINIIEIAQKIETEISKLGINQDITIAIMGCIVNGPGEAKEADIGIAGGNGKAVLFKKGEVIRSIPEKDIVSELVWEIKKMVE